MKLLNKLAIESGIYFDGQEDQTLVSKDDLVDFAARIITQYQTEILAFQVAKDSHSLSECLFSAEVQMLE